MPFAVAPVITGRTSLDENFPPSPIVLVIDPFSSVSNRQIWRSPPGAWIVNLIFDPALTNAATIAEASAQAGYPANVKG